MWPSRPCWRRQEKSPNTPFGGGQEREKTSIESSGCTYAPADSVAYSEAPYCLRAWSTQGLRGATLTAQKYQTPSEPDPGGPVVPRPPKNRALPKWRALPCGRAGHGSTCAMHPSTIRDRCLHWCRGGLLMHNTVAARPASPLKSTAGRALSERKQTNCQHRVARQPRKALSQGETLGGVSQRALNPLLVRFTAQAFNFSQPFQWCQGGAG